MDFYRMLKPRTYAVIGASRNPRSPTYRLLMALINGGYPGKIFPVNPKADEILGLKVYPDTK
ncbi:MAG: CoA-binding protein, partial [Candidatus Helarchaeales archaeon]